MGEGLKHGDYFSYSMCHTDYKDCSKFRMDLWISGDMIVDNRAKWRAETVVYDGNYIAKGHMELDKASPEPTGGTHEIAKYRSAFKASIAWMSAFAHTFQPKEFRDELWNRSTAHWSERVKPESAEEINAAGRAWDAIQLGWRAGNASSKIWIVDGFPFPIKADVFAYVPAGIPHKEYEFVLLNYSEGITEDPFSGVVSTIKTAEQAMEERGCEIRFDKSMAVKKYTADAMYQVHVAYGPEEPRQGCIMKWQIKFISKYDETELLNQVQFDVLTLNEDGSPNRSLASEEGRRFLYAPSGQYLVDIPVIEGPGDISYVIQVYGVSPHNIVPSDPPDFAEIPITIREAMDTSLDGAGRVETDRQGLHGADHIPEWIRTSAGWWADGVIDDDTFVQGMQYLISQGIIQIPQTGADVRVDSPPEIPQWLRTSAGWWADGVIDDDTFVQGMRYLIQSGIMDIS